MIFAIQEPPPPPIAVPAQGLSISDLRIKRSAAGATVRGSMQAGPGGTPFKVVVSRGFKRAGTTTVNAAASGRTGYAVKLNKASARKLRKAGHLDVGVGVTAADPGASVSSSTGRRVRA